MKLRCVRGSEAIVPVAIGCAAALIFLFAFPKGAITTLMHAVLRLPGPGAGIALVLGPILVAVATVSSLLTKRTGAALVGAMAFAAVCVVAVQGLGIPTNPKGAFGSLSFVAAIALFGLVAEAASVPALAVREALRHALAGALANAVLLTFYFVAIFPRTARWVEWRHVPLLVGLCLVSGLATGYATSTPLERIWKRPTSERRG